MPQLDTTLHLEMLSTYKKTYPKKDYLIVRILRAIRNEISSKNIYGMEWGDPETIAPLKYFKNKFIAPYINASHTAVEIGPGGGRWTRYLCNFKKLYLVDYHQEILDEVNKNFNRSNIKFIRNSGSDFPNIESNSIDYLFSFGVFVHLDLNIIKSYLNNIYRVVKPEANIVIQYSDKTKIMAQEDICFSENNPEIMRLLVKNAGYKILEEDITSLWHSSIIRFSK
jgi:ubiquinone/menaquinone biosynthesis C-methylase UbiE